MLDSANMVDPDSLIELLARSVPEESGSEIQSTVSEALRVCVLTERVPEEVRRDILQTSYLEAVRAIEALYDQCRTSFVDYGWLDDTEANHARRSCATTVLQGCYDTLADVNRDYSALAESSGLELEHRELDLERDYVARAHFAVVRFVPEISE